MFTQKEKGIPLVCVAQPEKYTAGGQPIKSWKEYKNIHKDIESLC